MAGTGRYYRVLELRPGATLEEVKEAFRGLAKEWHPDLYPYDETMRVHCVEKMARINEAYDVLRRIAPSEDASGAKAEPKRNWQAPRASWGYDPEAPAGDPEPESERAAEPEPKSSAEDQPEPALEPWTGKTAPPPRSWTSFWRQVRPDEPDTPGVLAVGAGFLASIIIMAALFFLGVPSENYYLLLRLVISASTLHGAVFALGRGSWEIALLLSLLGLAINPVLIVRMSLEEWRVFNFLCPFALIYFWIVLFDREQKKALRAGIEPKRSFEE